MFMGFEEEIRDIFDEEFVKRAVKLKITGNIFNPVFYILFTRLVEISSLINGIVLPTRFEIEEMFRTRKEFLQLDMRTINETLRQAWISEIRRGEEYRFSKGIEDLMYIVYRMRDIQKRIDDIILAHIKKWDKEEILELYFILGKVLLEIEEEIVDTASKRARVEWLKWLVEEMNIGPEIVENVFTVISKSSNPLAMIRLVEIEEYSEIEELHEIFEELDEAERKVILSGMKVVFREDLK